MGKSRIKKTWAWKSVITIKKFSIVPYRFTFLMCGSLFSLGTAWLCLTGALAAQGAATDSHVWREIVFNWEAHCRGGDGKGIWATWNTTFMRCCNNLNLKNPFWFWLNLFSSPHLCIFQFKKKSALFCGKQTLLRERVSSEVNSLVKFHKKLFNHPQY